MTEAVKFEGWAIVELMGHVRLAGRVSPAPMYGTELVRIDVPEGESYTTQFASGSSLYRLTPCSEEVARAVAGQNAVRPIESWELRRIEQARLPDHVAEPTAPVGTVYESYRPTQDGPNDEERIQTEKDEARWRELDAKAGREGLDDAERVEYQALAEDLGKDVLF